MQPFAALGLWAVELAAISALAGTPRGARLGLAIALLALPLPFWVAAPSVGLAALALAFLWTAVRAADLAFEPAPVGVGARAVHLVAVLDTRRLSRVAPHLDRWAWLRVGAALLVAAFGLAAVAAADAGPDWARYPLRWGGGATLALALLEASAATLEALAAACGRSTPMLHDSPHLALSIAEFWGHRWNRVVAAVLRARAFAPLARLDPWSALVAAFAMSAAFHAYLIGAAIGVTGAVAWTAFFLLQPLLIALERRLGVRRWRRGARRAWTVTALGLASPLMAEPGLQALGL